MDKTTFLETLQTTRSEWEALLVEVGDERMIQLGANGEWSVKDVIAHIMWGEREMVGVCQARALIGSELWELTDDERNPIMVSWYRNHTLSEVQEAEQRVYTQLLEAVQTLSEAELNNARFFREMPTDWLPWRIIAGCSFKHYRDHMQPIRDWLEHESQKDA